MKARNADGIASVIGLSIASLFALAREQWTPLSAHWPNAILIFMMICSLSLAVSAVRKPEKVALFSEGSAHRMVVSVLALLGWATGIHFLGFFISSAAFFYFFWWYVGRSVQIVEGSTSNGFTALVHLRAVILIMLVVAAFNYAFTVLLHVPLPKGWLL